MPEFTVIGAGLPRSGTASLKLALETLGFGPSYHMYEVFKEADRSKHWRKVLIAAAERQHAGDDQDLFIKSELKRLVEGYGSGVDSPVSDLYQDFFEVFPDAKVILTVRPPDVWWHSFTSTIAHVGDRSYGFLTYWNSSPYWQRRMVLEGIYPLWESRYGCEQIGPKVMDLRKAEVIKAIPKEKLLVFEVTQGWEPLCKFLGVPIPNQPFPKSNDADMVAKYIGKMLKEGALIWLFVLGSAIGVTSVALKQFNKTR